MIGTIIEKWTRHFLFLPRDFDCNIVVFLEKMAAVFLTRDYYGGYRSPPSMNDILGDGADSTCVFVHVWTCVCNKCTR